MVRAVAIQVTLAAGWPGFLIIQSAQAVWLHDVQIKVDEMGIVDRIALGIADAVCIVTGGAWRPSFLDMLFVILEALVTENACPAVAGIAEFIGLGAFGGVVGRRVILRQQKGVIGTMRSPRAIGVIIVMAVCTVDFARHCVGRQQARYIRIDAWPCHRMEGRIGLIEFQPDIQLRDLPGNGKACGDIVIPVALVADFVLILRVLDSLPRCINAADACYRA